MLLEAIDNKDFKLVKRVIDVGANFNILDKVHTI